MKRPLFIKLAFILNHHIILLKHFLEDDLDDHKDEIFYAITTDTTRHNLPLFIKISQILQMTSC